LPQDFLERGCVIARFRYTLLSVPFGAGFQSEGTLVWRQSEERPWMDGWLHDGPNCHRSSVVERTLGKGEVTGSNPVGGLGLHVVVGVLRQ
jgi:hypothetical protein